MAKPIMPTGKKGLAKWSTGDLMVTAVISVVFAILLLGATYLFTIFIMPLGPLAMFAASGLWFIPPIFIAYILRRPGAALLAQAMIRTALVPFSPWGWMELTAIVAAGLPIELVFWATRYRNYRLSILILAGIVPGLVVVVIGWVPFGLVLLPIEMQIASVAAAIIRAWAEITFTVQKISSSFFSGLIV